MASGRELGCLELQTSTFHALPLPSVLRNEPLVSGGSDQGGCSSFELIDRSLFQAGFLRSTGGPYFTENCAVWKLALASGGSMVGADIPLQNPG